MKNPCLLRIAVTSHILKKTRRALATIVQRSGESGLVSYLIIFGD